MKLVNLLSFLMTFSLCASLEQDLIKLSVELASLQMHIEPEKKLPTIEVSASSVIYTLGNGKRIKLLIGDITKLNVFNKNTGEFSSLPVDAIVNAANEACLGGGGIDGAIHKAISDIIGKQVFAEICKNLPQKYGNNRCKTGDAELVPGVTLAKFIVQAVGPTGSMPNRMNLLKGAYENSLKVVDKSSDELKKLFDLKHKDSSASNREIYKNNGIVIPSDLSIKTIAFPSISTGIFAYPKDEAAGIAVDTVYDYLMNNSESSIEEVLFILYIPNNINETNQDYNRYISLLNKKLGFDEDQGKKK